MAAPPKLRLAVLVVLAACVGCEDSPVAPTAAAEAVAELSGVGLPPLDSLTPPSVAARLVERAEARLAAAPAGLDSATHARAVRLTLGSRKALDDGDFARAIRRAYYAGQLLAPR